MFFSCYNVFIGNKICTTIHDRFEIKLDSLDFRYEIVGNTSFWGSLPKFSTGYFQVILDEVRSGWVR